MYQVILYKENESRIGFEGDFASCINWMAFTPIDAKWREWELKAVRKSKVFDMSKITPMGSIKKDY